MKQLNKKHMTTLEEFDAERYRVAAKIDDLQQRLSETQAVLPSILAVIFFNINLCWVLQDELARKQKESNDRQAALKTLEQVHATSAEEALLPSDRDHSSTKSGAWWQITALQAQLSEQQNKAYSLSLEARNPPSLPDPAAIGTLVLQ